MREEENFLIIRDLAEVTIPLFAIVDVDRNSLAFLLIHSRYSLQRQNGPRIDRVLREIKRDGTSKEGLRREEGRHFSISVFVDCMMSVKTCKSNRGRRTMREMGERRKGARPPRNYIGIMIPKIGFQNKYGKETDTYIDF